MTHRFNYDIPFGNYGKKIHEINKWMADVTGDEDYMLALSFVYSISGANRFLMVVNSEEDETMFRLKFGY